MEKSINVFAENLAAVRAGRANPAILNKVKVDYYGTPTPIQQVGNITVPDPRMIQIAPWEKSLIKEIEKAIILLWLDEYSYDEIADTLGLKRNTVAIKIHRIKNKLSKSL